MFSHKDQVPSSFLLDFVAISSLPELWIHHTSTEIATSLAGILLNSLSLDIVYVYFDTGADNEKIEVAYSKSGKLGGEQVREIGRMLETSLSNRGAEELHVTIDNPIEHGALQAVVMPMGVTGLHGYLVAASQEQGFPNELNHLFLRLSVNQAAVILHQKQMENALRVAYDEMESRVEDRTKELSAAINALKDEIIVRKRIEAEVIELQRRRSESREAERLFLAQELHDGAVQELLALSYNLAALPDEAQAPQLTSVQDGIMQVVDTLRMLCEELRPSALISSGLTDAMRSHIEQFKKQHPKFDIQMELAQDGTLLSEKTRLALYRIYQQALANIVRHAQADQIIVCFRLEDSHAVLEVQDNGRGFTVPENWIDYARQGHLGLIGVVERAESVGGNLTIHSAPGKGTKIQARVPFNTQADNSRNSADLTE